MISLPDHVTSKPTVPTPRAQVNLASQNSDADLSGHGIKPVDIIDFTLEAAGLNGPEGLDCVPRWWNW